MTHGIGWKWNNFGNVEYREGTAWWDGQIGASWQRDRLWVVVDPSRPELGVRIPAKLINTYISSRMAENGTPIDTVWEVISRYAPSEDNNNVVAYARHVCARIAAHIGESVGIHDELDWHDWRVIRGCIDGMIRHEQGIRDSDPWPAPLSDEVIDLGIRLAGFDVPNERVYRHFIPAPKPLRQSRTVQGGAAAAVGTGGFGLLTILDWIWGRVGEANTVQLVFAVVILIGVGVMIWGYVKARREGRVDVGSA